MIMAARAMMFKSRAATKEKTKLESGNRLEIEREEQTKNGPPAGADFTRHICSLVLE
jgi:hypothetical protein